MFSLAMDTSREATLMTYKLSANLTPTERMLKLSSLMRGVSQLAIQAIYMKYPNISDEDLYVEYAAKLHGRDVAETVFRQIAKDRHNND